jgi:hypothetical protein
LRPHPAIPWHAFSAKPFLRLIGFDFELTVALSTEWLESEGILEVTLPEEGFGKPYRPKRRKSRRSSGESEEKEAAASA